jgi:hypothetical protein
LSPLAAQERRGPSDAANKTAKKTEKKHNEAARPEPAGLVVTVDPRTHEVRQATPEEIKALTERRKASGLEAVPGLARRGAMQKLRHESGADGVQLDDSYMTSMVVTVEPDGNVNYHCEEGKKQDMAKTTGKEKAHEK